MVSITADNICGWPSRSCSALNLHVGIALPGLYLEMAEHSELGECQRRAGYTTKGTSCITMDEHLVIHELLCVCTG